MSDVCFSARRFSWRRSYISAIGHEESSLMAYISACGRAGAVVDIVLLPPDCRRELPHA